MNIGESFGNRLDIFKHYTLICPKCEISYKPDPYLFTCTKCGELLDAILNTREVNYKIHSCKGIWKFKELLPRVSEVITLCEGNTPLIKLVHSIGKNTYVKFEGLNPTGSFKDRGMTVGVSIAKSIGSKFVIVASTGNTAASAAAYCARAGIKCIVVLPKGGVAKGKLAQAILHDAIIFEVEGSFDKALEYVITEITNEKFRGSIYPLNSFNVWRLEGQKTIAFEIFEEIGVPDNVIVPVGNAGNIYAIWKGFKELKDLGIIDKIPRMIGVQAEGAAPLANAWKLGLNKPIFIDKPNTIASAIRIGKPVNWFRAWRAVKYSNGLFVTVNDQEILNAQKKLAKEGLAVEPASASTLAGFEKLIQEKIIDKDEKTVLIATGHGLKDPDVIQLHKLDLLRVNSLREFENIIMKLLNSS